MLRRRVAPAIARLSGADASIEAGKRAFIAIGKDQISHLGAAMQLDEMRASNHIATIVKNVTDAQALVADAKDFPDKPTTSDALIASDVKQKIQAVVEAQQLAINVLNGTIETERLGRMQHEGLDTIRGIVGPETAVAAAGVGEPLSYLGVAGLAASDDLVVDPRSVLASGLAADTLYGKIAFAVYSQQGHIAYLESVLTATLVSLEKGCPA